MVPMRKEMKAATIGEPDALPSKALVGAWTARRTPPITARTSERKAPFIPLCSIEQVAMLTRLRSQILRRRLDLAAERRGRVPWPARIVKHAASKRDQIGIAGADDRFGLLEIGDEADGDDRHVHGSLDRAGERHLVARADRNLLARVETAG